MLFYRRLSLHSYIIGVVLSNIQNKTILYAITILQKDLNVVITFHFRLLFFSKWVDCTLLSLIMKWNSIKKFFLCDDRFRSSHPCAPTHTQHTSIAKNYTFLSFSYQKETFSILCFRPGSHNLPHYFFIRAEYFTLAVMLGLLTCEEALGAPAVASLRSRTLLPASSNSSGPGGSKIMGEDLLLRSWVRCRPFGGSPWRTASTHRWKTTRMSTASRILPSDVDLLPEATMIFSLLAKNFTPMIHYCTIHAARMKK